MHRWVCTALCALLALSAAEGHRSLREVVSSGTTTATGSGTVRSSGSTEVVAGGPGTTTTTMGGSSPAPSTPSSTPATSGSGGGTTTAVAAAQASVNNQVGSALSSASSFASYFSDWQSTYSVSYGSASATAQAGQNFRTNLQTIQSINNNPSSTYYAAPNPFTDLSFAQFSSTRLGLKKPSGASGPVVTSGGGLKAAITRSGSHPSKVNWVSDGKVTPIKNQEACGSCWTFASVAALESRQLISGGKSWDLAEQELVDCCNSQFGYKSDGCSGGWPSDALNYVYTFNVTTEGRYPYKASDGSCQLDVLRKLSPSDVVKTKTSPGYAEVEGGSKEALMNAVAQAPTVIGFAVTDSFQNYGGGVYSPEDCSGTDINHAMVAVGYDTTGSSPYWLIRNSWSEKWGEKGYAKVAMTDASPCGLYDYGWVPLE